MTKLAMTGLDLTAGLSGLGSRACVALSAGLAHLSVCEQERVTRTRGAGWNSSGLPDEALDLLLERLGCTRQDVVRYATAEAGAHFSEGRSVARFDHHLAHACTAYLSSPFTSAAILVCDDASPKVSVWRGQGQTITREEWPWAGTGFADLLTAIASVMGFPSHAGGQRLEALARLEAHNRDERLATLLRSDCHSITTEPGWESSIESWAADTRKGAGVVGSARLAAALQNRIADLLIELIARIRRYTDESRLCVAGSLFYNSSINTAVKRAGLFDEVFVPIDPGNPGLAVGTALHADRRSPQRLSPFLGPSYDAAEIKATLDNCKLRYDWKSEDAIIDHAVAALCRGQLVAWFDGAMEWGPRALGARSILASPFSPYVLENLNAFLKRRQPWRGYALSVLEGAVPRHFDGPGSAPFMESDYRPRDFATFRHVLPATNAVVRIHTVDRTSPPRFRRLLEAFGSATGIPCIVNTSFNGFHEPIVCSPRDAVRVFYGSGLDMLVLDQFALTK